jgi:hypothetical protein
MPYPLGHEDNTTGPTHQTHQFTNTARQQNNKYTTHTNKQQQHQNKLNQTLRQNTFLQKLYTPYFHIHHSINHTQHQSTATSINRNIKQNQKTNTQIRTSKHFHNRNLQCDQHLQ